MRTYLLPPEGNLYKANLHCHTTVSDGDFSPAQVKDFYKERGYHAVAFTDHQVCLPHPELNDPDFVAFTGIEIAYGIRKSTSIHVCGIARDPETVLQHPNTIENDIGLLNEGICLLNSKNFITTLNHPRWSGISAADIAAIQGFANMEVVNGYELMLDGYGDSSCCYEDALRTGRKIRPFATDDNHHQNTPNVPGYEFFKGFTVLKAPALTYAHLIEALDTGAFFASTGPMFQNLWLEDGILHLECSPVRGVYVHGNLYRHRASHVTSEDSITCLDLDISKVFADSSYLFVKIVETQGKCAWACPAWLK